MNDNFMNDYEEKNMTKPSRKSQLKYLSTSYLPIDDALGGQGLPLGKVIDIAGEAGVGKSAIVQDIMKQAEEHGLSCVYLDIDKKLDAYWARERTGLDIDNLLIFEPKNIEGISEACLTLMKEGLADLIIFDSISALNLNSETITLKEVLNPLLQKLLEYNTSLIFLSQVREDLVEHCKTTPYNSVLDDICNIRIMLKTLHIIKQEELEIGKTLEVNVYKNELGVPSVKQIDLFN